MQNIELAPENPFSAPLEESTPHESEDDWGAIIEILAVAVLRNRFRRKQKAD